MANSHKLVSQADAHPPATHASTHNAGGSDAMTNPQFTTIELGAASDTTLARVSAGVVSIEGTNIVKAGAATGSGLTMATARLLGRTTASSGAIEEITVGSGLSLAAGSLTASGGGTPSFVGCRAYNSGQQTINDATDTAITFDSEEFDTSTFHSTGANTSRFTVPSTGKYLINTLGYWNSSITVKTLFISYLKLNGTTMVKGRRRYHIPTDAGGFESTISHTAILSLTASDYVEWFIYQDGTGNKDIGGGSNYETIFEITLLGT